MIKLRPTRKELLETFKYVDSYLREQSDKSELTTDERDAGIDIIVAMVESGICNCCEPMLHAYLHFSYEGFVALGMIEKGNSNAH